MVTVSVGYSQEIDWTCIAPKVQYLLKEKFSLIQCFY